MNFYVNTSPANAPHYFDATQYLENIEKQGQWIDMV